ncbi:MAG: type II secretion system protein [Planctomycetaceae bacterium]|nr:type II secretion system protein [Planctomycetales bacterium]MCB9922984.1 type II secretion system protein [Planctomycetaceae bacterium]
MHRTGGKYASSQFIPDKPIATSDLESLCDPVGENARVVAGKVVFRSLGRVFVRRFFTTNRGFTLLEIVVVVLIL